MKILKRRGIRFSFGVLDKSDNNYSLFHLHTQSILIVEERPLIVRWVVGSIPH